MLYNLQVPKLHGITRLHEPHKLKVSNTNIFVFQKPVPALSIPQSQIQCAFDEVREVAAISPGDFKKSLPL